MQVQVFRDKKDEAHFTIVTMEGATHGILSFGKGEPPAKLHLVAREGSSNSWILRKRKNEPMTLSTNNPFTVEEFDPILEGWKTIPVYELSGPILRGLYSSAAESLNIMFGIRPSIRPRIDLGTDKVVTRPGTFLVDDLVQANVGRSMIRHLININVFHLPKSA